MRSSLFSVLTVASSSSSLLVSALATPPTFNIPTANLQPLPDDAFTKFAASPLSVDQIQNLTTVTTESAPSDVSTNSVSDDEESSMLFSTNSVSTLAAGDTCTNPRYRREWHSMSVADRNAFINSIKCLMSRPPSGRWPAARNRYEDLVALHQSYTPNIHGNAKFLIWHRYYTWTFEQLLRDECGLTTDMPWFDETKYTGRFAQSSIFTNDYFGPIHYPNGGCVTTGQFANLALSIGPGSGNQLHCLQRRGDASITGRITLAIVDQCNNFGSYRGMAACSEGQAHAFGHNGVGAVMLDMYSSPGDPVFFLHHAFVDHSYRIWQNQNPSRITAAGMNGNDVHGQPLTLNTIVDMGGIRPNVRIGDIINTLGSTLCYRYDY